MTGTIIGRCVRITFGHFARSVDSVLESAHEVDDRFLFQAVAMDGRDAANRPVVFRHVDRAVVGEARHAVSSQVGEESLVGQRAGHDAARLGEKLLRVDGLGESGDGARRRRGRVLDTLHHSVEHARPAGRSRRCVQRPRASATSPFAIASAAFVSSVSGRTRRRVAIHERNAPAAANRNASVPRTRSDAVCFARMPLSGCSMETESGVPWTGALALSIVPTSGRSTRPRLSNSSRCRSGAETGSPVNCTQFEPAASWM